MRPRAICPHETDTPVSRRSVIAGSIGIAGVAAASPLYAAEPATADDERFMRMAIEEARRADFPFGAVIVQGGRVLARGRNLGRSQDDPTAHGEMVAIRRCLTQHGSRPLKGATLYTSGEPCAMCMGAILWSHMGRLVFAASVQQLATRGSTRSCCRVPRSLLGRRLRRSPLPAESWQRKRCGSSRNS